MIQWWYADNGAQTGPVDFDALGRLMRGGRISAETLVWHEGMAGWQAIGSLAELRSLFVTAGAQMRPPAPPAMPGRQVATPYHGDAQAAGYVQTPKRGMGTGLKVLIGLVCSVVILFVLGVVILVSNADFRKGFMASWNRQKQAQQEVAQSPAASAGQIWRNPVTGQTVTISDGWTEEDITSSSPDAKFARWFSHKTGRSAIGVVEEDACLGKNGFESYVDSSRATMLSQNDLLEPEKLSHAGEIDMWEAHFREKDAFNKHQDVQLLRIGNRQCWSITAFYNLADPGGEEAVNTLRAQLLQTMR